MAKSKKKTLPKDFGELCAKADLETLKEVFETCDLDARGGYTKKTALAFLECPDELARWLVERGADISARDSYEETPLHTRAHFKQGRLEILLELGADVHLRDKNGNTPLHKAAAGYQAPNVKMLLKNGARADAENNEHQTPLSYALSRCRNSDITALSQVADLLLAASPVPQMKGFLSKLFGSAQVAVSAVTQDIKESVVRIGTEFEFHRDGFNPDYLDATSDALERLYRMFDVPPVPRRARYDGKSPIVVVGASWEERHQQLWELLVPSRGVSSTVQGEVVRISGRIHDEFERNGGSNWDADFKNMAEAFLEYTDSGVPLSNDERAEARGLVADVKLRRGNTARLCELAVNWVARNPKPLKLPSPNYRR